ncbi:hypothetical protein SKAU_G00423560 [Synaphobranchus kaupii]|uniref:Uncharacterized protein n=1 Tax=Synaphobranchus kaupii TaxID=118154 RepID=A0A9Q1IAJ7_SYNKA|nr:hypothetical protein SKAU_G00423560 [Synaphobranchus kaupii]
MLKHRCDVAKLLPRRLTCIHGDTSAYLYLFHARSDRDSVLNSRQQHSAGRAQAFGLFGLDLKRVVFVFDVKPQKFGNHQSNRIHDPAATLPSMDECELSSMSRPPFTGVVDSTSLTNTNSQSDYMSDFTLLSSTTSVKEIKTESVMDSTYYTGVETRSNLNRCEDKEESIEKKTGSLMNQEEKDILINMKQEDEEGGERQSGARDEVRLWKKEEIKKDEQEEYGVTQQVTQTVKCEKNEGKSEDGQQEGEELSTLATSCLLNQPRVLIRRLEMADNSLPVQIAPLSIAGKRGQGTRSPWKLHELSPQRGNGSLWPEGHVVTRKRRTVGQLDRPLKVRPSSSDKE